MMLSTGAWRRLFCVLLIAATATWALQSCGAGAIRKLPTGETVPKTEMVEMRPGGMNRVVTIGRRPFPMAPTGAGPSRVASAAEVRESKRRVPSCPDPLHNR